MRKHRSKEEEIADFREHELLYYKKIACSEQEQNYIKKRAIRMKGILNQIKRLSEILSFQEKAYSDLKKIVDVKCKEVAELREKLERFKEYTTTVDKK